MNRMPIGFLALSAILASSVVAMADVTVDDVAVRAELSGENITLDLSFVAEAKRSRQDVVLIAGDVVLDAVHRPGSGFTLAYDAADQAYRMRLSKSGRHEIKATFAARAQHLADATWREATFTVPHARMRRIEVVCDRTDLEVQFPDAMRVERRMADGRLILTALLGADRPFIVRWKPQVQKLDAELVLAGEANVIATIQPGVLRLDTTVSYDIAQGQASQIRLAVPADLNITQVRGDHIRDWSLGAPDDEGTRVLLVDLNRPQTERYALHVLAERQLPELPGDLDVPVLQPLDVMRASGHVAVGTNSAIQLLVQRTSGLAQIDAMAFPRVTAAQGSPREIPTAKTFFYSYATPGYELALRLDDIVPSFDAAHRVLVHLSEDEMTVTAAFEIDVRDAPIRSITVDVPSEMVVAAVGGTLVEPDAYTVHESDPPQAARAVEVHFTKPVIGRTVVQMRLELGRSPLDAEQVVHAPTVRDAQTQRGYLVVVADDEVKLDDPVGTDLRAVHTGSVPMRVPNAQYAYRFRDADWSLALSATRRPAGIRLEAFHLISLGEGIAYHTVVFSYFITGSPIDQLQFEMTDPPKHIQFVGRDVRGWSQDNGRFTVDLHRKVIGDYNIAVDFTRRYDDSQGVLIGDIAGADVTSQGGYLVVASHMDLEYNATLDPDRSDEDLFAIGREDLPANYRLLVHAPILAAYKFLGLPPRQPVTVSMYDRNDLLPALIEVTELATVLDLRDDADIESVTTVRYKLKNASSQYLALSLPDGDQLWATRMLSADAEGRPAMRRIAASIDAGTGRLLIPIERRRNPNDPITVEVVYGRVHQGVRPTDELTLHAPSAGARATFSGWTVTVPETWAVNGRGLNMVADPRAGASGDLWPLLRVAGAAWRSALDSAFPSWTAVGGAVILVIVLLLALVFRRAALPDVIALLLVVVMVWLTGLSIGALDATEIAPADDALRAMRFTQTLSPDAATPLSVQVRAVPAWRTKISLAQTWIAGILSILCFAAVAVWGLRKAGGDQPDRTPIAPAGRLLLLALGLGFALHVAAQLARLPAISAGASLIVTCGVPALLLGWYLCVGITRIVRLTGHPVATASVIVAACLLAPGGCATSATAAEVLTDQPMARDVQCTLTVGDDSVEIDMTVIVASDEAITLPLVDRRAILMSDDEPHRDVKVIDQGDRYALQIARRGRYELKLQFLSPLGAPDGDQSRRFTLDLPPSLTNAVELIVPDAGVEIQSPQAVRMTRRETDDTTIARAMFAPGTPAQFIWRPRARSVDREQTMFIAEVLTIARFDTGLAEAHHQVKYQIAQGQISEMQISVPGSMTVTSVQGEHVGTWRFDPATRQLEARLTAPVAGNYVLTVLAQQPIESLPATLEIAGLEIQGAASQRGAIGLAATNSVHVTATGDLAPMNAADFGRAASALLEGPGARPLPDVRHAYRLPDDRRLLSIALSAVQSELRVRENASFSISDERMEYNVDLTIDIAKAGRFGIDLHLPAGYDIDTLVADAVSHWDEQSETDAARAVHVHFRNKVLGSVPLKMTLSRAVTELPRQLIVPRISVAESIKHVGQVVIAAERGVQLTVGERHGVSELNPLDLGLTNREALTFKLLQPDWMLKLNTEVVKPRINVDFLHRAHVTEGTVRHTQSLRYELHNAGVKVFELDIPEGARGLEVMGPKIARWERVDDDPTRLRVELDSKWFDRTYPLTLRYETRFRLADGQVSLPPVWCHAADHQRGYVVVTVTDRVELTSPDVGPSLAPAEPRTIDASFGVGDLSSAAFCYRALAGDYQLALSVRRHGSASLLGAQVRQCRIHSVMSTDGRTINLAELELLPGSKRYLNVRLPDGAEVWSLLVNRRSVTPAQHVVGTQRTLLVPLPQAGGSELSVRVVLTYVMNTPPNKGLAGRYDGPRFDLPLRDIAWRLYVPPEFDYGDFEGTLAVNEKLARDPDVIHYDGSWYDRELQLRAQTDNTFAVQMQKLGQDYAREGNQRGAKQALETAWHYSMSDRALNEDARVQLHRLVRGQTLVGLVGNRKRLRVTDGQGAPDAAQAAPELNENFREADADRLRGALSQADTENLEVITDQIINAQSAAAGERVQLMVTIPARGRILEFTRPLQVDPFAEMSVSFDADRVVRHAWHPWTPSLLAAIVLFLVIMITTQAARQWPAMRAGLKPRDYDDLFMDDQDDGLDGSDAHEPDTM